mmetsp:Transcript_15929/g.20843  ORF Transcript_15929/g.20843 Transcript_15929/m.20843 type:complete len:333 (+) Transcript_15929:134-1132(+)
MMKKPPLRVFLCLCFLTVNMTFHVHQRSLSMSMYLTMFQFEKPWTSEHLFDCQNSMVQDKYNNSNSSGNEPIFATTSLDPPFPMSIYDPKEDVFVSGHIHRDGCWECSYVQKMLDVLSLDPDSYLLDVGGNIGMFTLAAANAQRETFTIEPFQENYSRICESVNKNSFHDRVHLLTIVATQTELAFRLKIPGENKGGVSVVPVTADDVDTGNGGDDAVDIIKGFTIDSLNLPTDRPVVMKMDVEGHELQALLGALEFIREANIVLILIEHTTEELQKDRDGWKKAFDLLSSKGLVPFRLDSGKEIELNPNNLDEWRHPTYPQFDAIWRKKTD